MEWWFENNLNQSDRAPLTFINFLTTQCQIMLHVMLYSRCYLLKIAPLLSTEDIDMNIGDDCFLAAQTVFAVR